MGCSLNKADTTILRTLLLVSTSTCTNSDDLKQVDELKVATSSSETWLSDDDNDYDELIAEYTQLGRPSYVQVVERQVSNGSWRQIININTTIQDSDMTELDRSRNADTNSRSASLTTTVCDVEVTLIVMETDDDEDDDDEDSDDDDENEDVQCHCLDLLLDCDRQHISSKSDVIEKTPRLSLSHSDCALKSHPVQQSNKSYFSWFNGRSI